MTVVCGGLCPHPPIMVPEVGRESAELVKASQEAMLELGRRIKAASAEVLVMISPHGPVFRDGVVVSGEEEVEGDLSSFRARQVHLKFKVDRELAGAIRKEAVSYGLLVREFTRRLARQVDLSYRLDHGLMVPLYFLRRAGVDLPLVTAGMALLPREELYAFGLAVRKAAEKVGRKVAFLASGDLSHRLTPEAPAGYDPVGKEFDRRIGELLAKGDVEGIINLPEEWVERAGECGLRPLIMMLGAFEGQEIKAEVLSYEGPFGVGYMVAHIEPRGENSERCFYARWQEVKEKERRAQREKESFPVRVARRALEKYYSGQHWQKLIDLYDGGEIPPEFQKQAGVFVSLKKYGQLRGCIGTVVPTQPSIVEEIIYNALNAATKDPRFLPVTAEELPALTITVDVLQPPEPIESMAELDPRQYGVIVRSGGRSGLLLPDLEGVDTPEQQVAIARQKAGIGPHEPVRLERFRVIRYY